MNMGQLSIYLYCLQFSHKWLIALTVGSSQRHVFLWEYIFMLSLCAWWLLWELGSEMSRKLCLLSWECTVSHHLDSCRARARAAAGLLLCSVTLPIYQGWAKCSMVWSRSPEGAKFFYKYDGYLQLGLGHCWGLRTSGWTLCWFYFFPRGYLG